MSDKNVAGVMSRCLTLCAAILAGPGLAQDAVHEPPVPAESTEAAPQEQPSAEAAPPPEAAVVEPEAPADAGAVAEPAVEEVVVTAQKRAQRIEDVPIAMDVFTAQDVDVRQIESVADLAVQTPSLTFGHIAGVGQISIRGVGFGLIAGSGENSVAVHSDGVYIAAPGAMMLLQEDVSSIEVLKGPQGTLWGRNATAGVINFITPRPAADFEGSVEMGLGNYDLRTTSAQISIPLGERVRTRLSAAATDHEGYVENTFLGTRIGQLDRTALRAAVDFDVSENLVAELRGFRAREIWGGPTTDPIDGTVLTPGTGIQPGQFDLDPYRTRMGVNPSMDSKLSGGSLRLHWEIAPDIQLSSITGAVNFHSDNDDLDFDGTPVEHLNIDRFAVNKTRSQEFNLSGEHGRLTWLLGLFLFDQETVAESHPVDSRGVTALVGLRSILIRFNEDTRSAALFADATYALSERLRLYGGLRGLQEEKDSRYYQELGFDAGALPFIGYFQAAALDPTTDPAAFGITPDQLADVAANGFANFLTGEETVLATCEAEPLALSKDEDDVTGRAGLQFDALDSTMIYMQYATGYKSGGFANAGCDNYFKPETLASIEGGFKAVLADGRLRLNGAVFSYDYSDLQVEEIVNSAAFINNADAEILGAEFDASMLVSDAFQFNAGLTLLDAEYTRFSNTDGISGIALGEQDLDGNPLLRSPDWAANLGGQYDRRMGSFGALSLRADALWNAGYQLREFNLEADEQDSFLMLNSTLTYTPAEGSWSLKAWVKNATDEAVLGGIMNISAVASAGIRGGAYGPPRTFGLTASARF